MITLTDVCKRYISGDGGVRALERVCLHILRGEFVAIVGPSGSGKSTLLNVLGCLDSPDSGAYRFNSLDLCRSTDAQLARLRNRSIGFVFQGFHLINRLTALQNIEQSMLYGGVARGERRVRALALLAQLGLEDRAHHLPTQLSGGQQQRVALARALANDPELIIADEPTGNLDSVTADAVLTLLQAQHHRGKTLILVTHDAAVAARANRTVHMRDGAIMSLSE